MSNAGRGKPNRVPGMHTPGNGIEPMGVPEDLVWDEDDPPVIFPCSQHITHAPFCSGEEDGIQLDSELQVDLMNEGRAWARAGMSFQGVPAAYEGVIPKPGIKIEMVDMLCWLEVLKEQVIQLSGGTPFEFEEDFRKFKLRFMREIREENEAAIRRQRVANSLGIIEKPPLLGPDGQPI